ncbi:MAG TPA: ABC transporter permease, partial [Novosphingobium sp.]|nr:ABC transporter permease [Novosphingobium sp.]
MTATPIRKDSFDVDQEVSPPADAAVAVTAAARPAGLPFGITLPPARVLFDAAWPPLAGIVGFLGLWALLAPTVNTSLGALPGPLDVWQAFGGLMEENAAARVDAAAMVAAGGGYSGPPTFVDQIFTSLQTVAMGFVLASLIAVPLGLVAGMSRRFNAAINPLVQVMRPVSPLAWLPIVTMVVSASITSDDPTLAK